MPWIQAHITVDKQQIPQVELLLENLGALSITLGDAGDEPMLEPGPGETPLWSKTQVTGLFRGDVEIDNVRSQITQALNIDSICQLRLELVADKEWERAWMDEYQATKFGRRLWICPSGKQIEESGAVVVTLDPGLAFGTGTHPTTALCLEWLDGMDLAGKSIIDFGCGSGILAIAALKLGAAKATAVDHDPQAILATRSNAELNHVSARLDAYLSDQFEHQTADIVVANILANTLVELASQIESLLKPGGLLVLSGVLPEQTESVMSAYRESLKFKEPVTSNGWVRIEGIK